MTEVKILGYRSMIDELIDFLESVGVKHLGVNVIWKDIVPTRGRSFDEMIVKLNEGDFNWARLSMPSSIYISKRKDGLAYWVSKPAGIMY